ncbi:glycosyltransferase family 4 protein [Candidatus Gracilibacteria bacterium]|nr:glycosyltransferase family 4 protein [Candidatus Gracilibacteria bacterium]
MIAPFGIRPKGTLSQRMLPLAQALVRRGHQVSIVAPPVQNPEDAGTLAVYDGVPVLHLPLPRLPGPAAIAEQSLALRNAALWDAPDLLHLFKPKGFGGLAALLPRRVPLVVDSDDWEGWGGWNELLPYPYPAKMLFAWQEHHLPRRAQAVTVASRTLESLVWSYGVQPERVVYLPNGIAPAGDPPTLLANVAPPTLLLYTRFWEFAVPDLLAALVVIHQRRPDVRLLVIGKGERAEEQALLSRAQRAGIATMIDYQGWVQPAQIPALLAQAQIALVPLDDTLINRARCSAKLIELMAAGLAVIVGDVGQSREYIRDGENGLLIAPHNPGALAVAALRLLDDPALTQRLRRAARHTNHDWNWDRLAPLAERAYQIAV